MCEGIVSWSEKFLLHPPFNHHNCRGYFPFFLSFFFFKLQNMDSRHTAKTNLKYSVVSCVTWCSVLTAESQMLARGHLNKYSPYEILPSRAWREGTGWREGVCFCLGQSDVRTHIQVNFFFHLYSFTLLQDVLKHSDLMPPCIHV